MISAPTEDEHPTQPRDQRSDDGAQHHPLENIPELLPRIEREQLTEESVAELKRILEKEIGRPITDEEAWESARNLLRLGAALFDISVDQELKRAGVERRSGVVPMTPEPPSPPPEPQVAPIRLDIDHKREVGDNLRIVADELSKVKQYPSSWRWATVALYQAVGHSLAAQLADAPKPSLHQLTELLDAVSKATPEMPQVRQSVEQLEVLRTTFITLGITQWPVSPKKRLEMFANCIRVIRRLVPDTEAACDAALRLLMISPGFSR